MYLTISERRDTSFPFYETMFNLPRKTRQENGLDDLTTYSIMKALGKEYFVFSEEWDNESGYVVLKVATHQKLGENAFMSVLRKALTQMMPTLTLPCDEMKVLKAVIYSSKSQAYPYYVKLTSSGAGEKELQASLK